MKILSLAILAATTLFLQAEDPRLGVQGLLNFPLGDLKTYVDSNPGIGIGVQATFDLGNGRMLRPRLDYCLFQQAALASVKRTASYLSLGGDYLYFVAGKPEGIYFSAGLSAVRWSLQYQDSVTDLRNDTTRLGASAGIGYQWDYNIGTEARWQHSSVSSGFKADSLQAVVTYRF